MVLLIGLYLMFFTPHWLCGLLMLLFLKDYNEKR